MRISRRQFVQQSAFGHAVLAVLGHRLKDSEDPAAALTKAARIRIGGCDWSFGKEGDVAAFGLAIVARDGVLVVIALLFTMASVVLITTSAL